MNPSDRTIIIESSLGEFKDFIVSRGVSDATAREWKKLRRRERNKKAAAVCRTRKVDHFETVHGELDRVRAETEHLRRKCREIEQQLRLVEMERDQLRQTHAVCEDTGHRLPLDGGSPVECSMSSASSDASTCASSQSAPPMELTQAGAIKAALQADRESRRPPTLYLPPKEAEETVSAVLNGIDIKTPANGELMSAALFFDSPFETEREESLVPAL